MLFAELIGSLKLGNVLVFVQLDTQDKEDRKSAVQKTKTLPYLRLPISSDGIPIFQEIDLSPLRRPGRLESEVILAVPSNAERADILRAILERSHVLRGIVPGIPVADMADATPGFTGADLVLVVSKLEREVGIQVQINDLVNLLLKHLSGR